jgi:hypothetical protein
MLFASVSTREVCIVERPTPPFVKRCVESYCRLPKKKKKSKARRRIGGGRIKDTTKQKGEG